jgi:hypothetical protein
MKNFMIVLAAAGTMFTAAPANAQVRIDAGPGGVEVGVGGSRHHHYRERHRGYRAYSAERCRYERTEITTPSGRVIVKKRRICG